jgi:ribulose 1,5-bisphosphate synthetase/thiazole synthase
MSGGPEEAFPASISESSCSLSYNDDIMTTTSSPRLSSSTTTTEPVVIAGAGIVGLVLALALDKHLGIKPRIFDQAPAFHDGVGAGIGMYPNGLRVIKDISPLLLARIQHEGIPYRQRRWEVSR